MKKNTQKIRPILAAMSVDQTETFDIARMRTVRTLASELGAILDRRYTTRTDREERTIKVKRVS